ncbi:GGDEF domain-containing response regulator [Desulfobacter curvatus]|uniref:GGDEF domain-containing response regulator n=1 Tax=Desulfobacter curvatus TaxID=2290 RepID=UPI00036BB679|nr:diguanylate cyclase [Desulfobacter curvatus]
MRILIAEDDPVSRRLLEAKLHKWGYDVVVTCNGDEAWEAFQAENAPRLAILDWMMPEVDGIEICRRMRRKASGLYTYIILLTTLYQDEDIVTGMEAGADDYITKPFKANELRVRLRAGRRIIELQKELIEARDALREKATRDSLTGLWNHEEIIRILREQLSRAERERGAVSIIMADLDHFKKVNDIHGHMAGDSVLRLTAKRMLSLMRDYDYIGRYGGEEFLVVLPGCDKRHAERIAERLCQVIGSKNMDIPEGMIPVTISLGVATTYKGQNSNANALVQAADIALYRAKENGRNRVEMAEAEDKKHG